MKTKFTLLLAFLCLGLLSYSQYCSLQPTFTPYSPNQPGITNFKLGTINRTSANTEGNNALVLTGTTVTLTIGQTYSFSITTSNDVVSGAPLTGAPQHCRIYVDFNSDFDFVDAGETAFTYDYITFSPTTAVSATYSNAIGVTVPATVVPGCSKLRVTAKMGPVAGHSPPSPCNNPPDGLGYHGEMEEYDVVFVAAGTTAAASIFTASPAACTSVAIVPANTSTGSPAPTYVWSSNPAATISNTSASTPSITFNSPGTYTLTLAANNACVPSTSTHTVLVSNCVGLSENNLVSENINVFPNPAKDKITIEIANLSSYNYQITDVLGKIIISASVNNKEKNQVDVSSINKGIYFLVVEGKGQKATKKIVIE